MANPNAGESLAAALGQGGSTDEDAGSVLVALHDVKEEIIPEFRHQDQRARAQADEILVKVRVLESKLDNLIPGFVSKLLAHRGVLTASRAGSSKSKGTSSKRKASDPPPPENVPYIDDLIEQDITDCLHKWTTAVTSLSFSKVYQRFDDGLPSGLKRELADSMHIFDGRSGLTTLFFSCEAYHAWDRYHSRSGKLWSFFVRRTISSILLEFRKSFFDLPTTPEQDLVGRSEPTWLTSFGGKDKQPKVVSEIVQMMETTDKMAKASRDPELLKRRKRMREGGGDSSPVAFEWERYYAIFELRGLVTRYWSYGRAEARKKLLREVMFLVEKIGSFQSNRIAREAGFWTEFKTPGYPDELEVPADPKGTVWDISSTLTKGGTQDELDANNKELLVDLIPNFPSLTLKLHFRRSIVNLDPSIDPNSYPSTYDDEKVVYLHNLALSVFAECMRVADTNTVLRSSPVSLKVVHVLACSLRGFILQSLRRDDVGASPGPVELCCMGTLTWKEAGKLDFETASTIGNSAVIQDGNPATGSMQSIRDEKATIALTAYKENLASEMTRRAARSADDTRSESGSVAQPPNAIADLTEDFLVLIRRVLIYKSLVFVLT